MRRKLKVIRRINDDFTLVEDWHTKEELEEIENEVGVGEGIVIPAGEPGESVDQALERARKAIREYEKQQKKVYSFRLKIKTVEGLKKKAAALGIPYQTYVGTILDQFAV
ncbi:hypothetical protein SAMN05720766_12610 [Fibrobacter sp. UWH9]|uniref:hypothetical protein n=1 Tax=unclassified Fibrobacter TaxID=2634177 RepID=UPI00090F5748|nr:MULTISPECIES: hypothetical protein [Fibrobacter]MCQ2100278.1 hypothetical protein [Fibrobacter sp.]SHH80679.1 hypothetical protein SAMN05720766_12610 [Fibrobacter sp. UWH9]SHL15045.1 hypothetical protein SAMN05720764_108100 [Fibrobacter sp. UWH5]MCL4103325.1 hypothetical protein [Fibrobacter succinogenes]SHL41691.1 hypothetical protein SAMN05720765_11480 [Fibrobacter sp. UWH6]